MIAYRDFNLRAPRYGLFGFGRDLTRVTLDGAVEAANAWIATEKIRVINVETNVVGEYGGLPGFRVWYEGSASDRKKSGEPEI